MQSSRTVFLLPSVVIVLLYSIYCVHAAGEPLKSQSLIPFPRVGRSRSMLNNGIGIGLNGGNNYQSPASLRSVLMNELREYKRHLIPFPRVGKRQTLIPFPRVGRAFLAANPADDNLDEEEFSAGAADRWGSQETSED